MRATELLGGEDDPACQEYAEDADLDMEEDET